MYMHAKWNVGFALDFKQLIGVYKFKSALFKFGKYGNKRFVGVLSYMHTGNGAVTSGLQRFFCYYFGGGIISPVATAQHTVTE